MTGSQVASAREAYLARLDAAARQLPEDRRIELVSEVREHIDAALLGGPGDEAALRTVLDALGAPEEIARAAVEQEPGAAPHPGSAQTGPQAASLRDVSTVRKRANFSMKRTSAQGSRGQSPNCLPSGPSPSAS